MRVEKKSWGSQAPWGLKKTREDEGKDFQQALEEKNTSFLKKSLEEHLREVDSHAAQLKEQLTRDNVATYQESVRKLLQVAVEEAYRILPQNRFDKKWRKKRMVIRDVVNQKLEEVLGVFVQEQTPYLRILKLLDEIRGLLIDLII